MSHIYHYSATISHYERGSYLVDGIITQDTRILDSVQYQKLKDRILEIHSRSSDKASYVNINSLTYHDEVPN